MQQKNVVQVVSVKDVMNVIRLLNAEVEICDEVATPYKYAGASGEVKFFEGQKKAYSDAVRYLNDMLVSKQYIEG